MLYFDRVLAFLPGALDINLVKISIKIGLSKIRCMSWPENHTRNFNFKLNEKHLWKTKKFTKPFGQAWHQIVFRFSFSLILLGALEINFENFDRFQTFDFWIKLLPCKIKSNFQKTFSYSNFWGSLSSYNTCKYTLFWSSSTIYAWSIRHKFGQNIHKNWAQSNSVHVMAWKSHPKFQFQIKWETFMKNKKIHKTFWSSVTPNCVSI